MKINKHVYNFDSIVVGSTIESILYAMYRGHPLLYKEEAQPSLLEYINTSDIDLNFIKNIKTKKMTGVSEQYCFYDGQRLKKFLLLMYSLAGKVPFAGKIKNIKLANESNISLITTTARKINIGFNNMYVCPNNFCMGFEIKQKCDKNIVLDTFFVECDRQDINFISGDDLFPQKMFFEGTTLYCLSEMTEEQLRDFSFSNVSLKYKLENILLNKNIGYTKKRKSYKIDFIRRQVFKNTYNEFKDRNNIKFINKNLKELCHLISKKEATTQWPDVYHWSLIKMILDSHGTTH
jgi:hypothetical protein